MVSSSYFVHGRPLSLDMGRTCPLLSIVDFAERLYYNRLVKVSFLFLAQPNSSNAYSSRDDDG